MSKATAEYSLYKASPALWAAFKLLQHGKEPRWDEIRRDLWATLTDQEKQDMTRVSKGIHSHGTGVSHE